MSTIKFSRTTGGVKITIDSGTPFFIEGEQEITTSASTDGNYVVVRWDGFDHPFRISHSFDVAGTVVTSSQSAIKSTIDAFLDGDTNSAGSGIVDAITFGADPTGTVDSSAALILAISKVPVNGIIYLPKGTYILTNIAITSNIKIEGDGTLKTIIKPSSGGTLKSIFTVADGVDDWTFSKLSFQGYNNIAGDESSNTLITNNSINGISLSGSSQRWVIDKCSFYGFNGYGIYAENPNTIQNQFFGGIISNCVFRRNFCGAYIGQRVEYCNIYSSGFYENTTSCWNKGGNNKYTSNSFKASYTGFFLDAGFNDAHGSLVGNDFNHCNIGFQAGATGNGEVIAGNSFQQCSIVCVGSAGLNFSGNNINIPSSKTITLTNVIGYFAHNNISSSPTLNVTGTGGLFEFGNYTNAGASYHLFSNPAIDINGAVVINHDSTQALVVNGQIIANPVTGKSGLVVNQNAATAGLKITGGTNPYFEVLNGTDGIKMQHAGSVGLIATESNIPLSLYANNVQMLKLLTAGRAILQNGGTFTDVTTALLQLNSTTTGLLIPRMTTAQRTAITLDGTNDGLQVYDITLHKLFVNENGAWVQK